MAREERVRMCSRKWLMVALIACGLASACSQYNTNLSIQTSSSVLTFVSPSSATVGSQGFTITANGSGFTTGTASTPYCGAQGFTLTVNGSNFTSDSVVNWNGVELLQQVSPTQFVSAT